MIFIMNCKYRLINTTVSVSDMAGNYYYHWIFVLTLIKNLFSIDNDIINNMNNVNSYIFFKRNSFKESYDYYIISRKFCMRKKYLINIDSTINLT